MLDYTTRTQMCWIRETSLHVCILLVTVISRHADQCHDTLLTLLSPSHSLDLPRNVCNCIISDL